MIDIIKEVEKLRSSNEEIRNLYLSLAELNVKGRVHDAIYAACAGFITGGLVTFFIMAH